MTRRQPQCPVSRPHLKSKLAVGLQSRRQATAQDQRDMIRERSPTKYHFTLRAGHLQIDQGHDAPGEVINDLTKYLDGKPVLGRVTVLAAGVAVVQPELTVALQIRECNWIVVDRDRDESGIARNAQAFGKLFSQKRAVHAVCSRGEWDRRPPLAFTYERGCIVEMALTTSANLSAKSSSHL